MDASAFSVFFDGGCPVCHREIEFYRRKAGAERLRWIDISAADFDARTYGLDAEAVKTYFHVRDERGRVVVGVPAFIEIWKRLPGLKSWVLASRLPGATSAMKLGYAVFARVRPYLPRREASECTSGRCEARVRSAG